MIAVHEVTKRFGSTVALDSVSFEVARGKILGFLGPNGAGKSTAMKIITTFLAPDSGRVTVGGIDVLEQPLAVRSRIGYLPENVPLYPDMSVHEYLSFVGRARGLSGHRLRQRLEWCVEACGLRTEYKKRIQELSKGYRQRTGLAQALIHDPDILILDEPTSGLDPLQIIGIRQLISSLAGQKTVIFSTHILQEVAPVTDHIVIINEGLIIADGQISRLTEQAMGDNRVYVGVRGPAAEVQNELRGIAGLSDLRLLSEPSPGTCRFELHAPFAQDLTADVAELAHRRNWTLTELHESRFSLEDTFIALTRAASARRDPIMGAQREVA